MRALCYFIKEILKLLIVILLGLLVLGVWFGYQKFAANNRSFVSNPTPKAISLATVMPSYSASFSASPKVNELEATAYVNTKAGFKIKAPKGWKVDESGKLGSLVVFTNPSTDSKEATATINVVSEQTKDTQADYVKKNKDALPNF